MLERVFTAVSRAGRGLARGAPATATFRILAQSSLLALGLSLVIAAGAEAQLSPSSDDPSTESPYALALLHVLDEHLEDRRVGIVFDRFPRLDLATRIAEARGHVAGPRHELITCQGELAEGRECWFTADVDHLVQLQREVRDDPGEMVLTFFISEQTGETPRRWIVGGERILTLERREDGSWFVVSDESGIRT